MIKIIATYKYRVKDKHTPELNRQSRAVNFVWNYCNQTQIYALNRDKKWLSAFDLNYLTIGSSKELDIHAHTIQSVCEQYVQSRQQFKKAKLKWRGKKSLGWIPCKGGIKFKGGIFTFRKKQYDIWLDRPIPEGINNLCCSFNRDARGRWYLNVTFKQEVITKYPVKECGIDLGLKSLATLSDANKIKTPQFYRKLESKLAKAQRAHKKNLTRKIHAKIKNQRKDYLHKASNQITKEYGLIVVGDVSSNEIIKINSAKSVYDVGWYSFKQMLCYKSIRNGGTYLEVNEAYTTQTCSSCHTRSGPKGIADLGIREWTCDTCGTHHDRDVNSAKSILQIGHDLLAEGVLASNSK